jgi:hypothetical protein
MYMSVQNTEVNEMSIPVAARSKAWVAGIAVSSLAGFVDVGLL